MGWYKNLKKTVKNLPNPFVTKESGAGGYKQGIGKFKADVEALAKKTELENTPPTIGDDAIEDAARAMRRRYGRAATMLTGGQGLQDAAPTARSTLLGA